MSTTKAPKMNIAYRIRERAADVHNITSGGWRKIHKDNLVSALLFIEKAKEILSKNK